MGGGNSGCLGSGTARTHEEGPDTVDVVFLAEGVVVTPQATGGNPVPDHDLSGLVRYGPVDLLVLGHRRCVTNYLKYFVDEGRVRRDR